LSLYRRPLSQKHLQKLLETCKSVHLASCVRIITAFVFPQFLQHQHRSLPRYYWLDPCRTAPISQLYNYICHIDVTKFCSEPHNHAIILHKSLGRTRGNQDVRECDEPTYVVPVNTRIRPMCKYRMPGYVH